MSTESLMNLIDSLIDEVKTGVLATVDTGGIPRQRWITPGILPGRPGSIFIVTASHFAKVAQAEKNPDASILLQTRLLDKVLSLQGRLSIIGNPLIRSELLERIGGRLNAFWRINVPDREMVTLQFVITGAVLYLPLEGTKEILEPDTGGQYE